MNKEEANLFEKDHQFLISIRVRGYDEQAKIKGKRTESLDFFLKFLNI